MGSKRGCWITSKVPTIHSNRPNRVITLTNQVLYYDGTLYLVPRKTETDNYSIPFNINKNKWDERPSHLHDIGCRYHQVIIIDLPLEILYTNYIEIDKDNNIICKDIPIEYLKVIDIDFNTCNDLLYKGMEVISNIPKYVTKLYRLAVNFNINWLNTGKNKIDINNIYVNKLYT